MAKVQVKDFTPQLIALAEDVAADALMEGAFAIEGRAKQIVASLPLVDTGSLMNSIHVRLPEESGRSKAVEQASRRPAKSRRTGKPVTEPPGIAPEPEAPGAGTAIVAAAVDYAVYHEMGTVNHKARPFLRPALEAVAKEMGVKVKAAARKKGL